MDLATIQRLQHITPKCEVIIPIIPITLYDAIAHIHPCTTKQSLKGISHSPTPLFHVFHVPHDLISSYNYFQQF